MFIKPNKTKAKLKAGQPAFGVISTSDDPQLAELFGIAGFDYYMLDAEHGLIDPIQALNVIRTCEIIDITPMIRIGSKDPKLVLQYLDAGMMGIMMPGLITAEDDKLLDKLPELCTVEGLDACVVGPRDLSLAMGFLDGPAHPEVQSVIDTAIGIINETGRIAGITAGTRADAEQQIQRGARMILAAAQSLVLAGSSSFLPEG